MNWQSSRAKPAWRSVATSQTRATFDALSARLNMLSPQNTRVEADAVKPAHQASFLPAFERMRVTGVVKRGVARCNTVADPAFGMTRAGLGAGLDYIGKGVVAGDMEAILPNNLAQRPTGMEIVERKNRPFFRFDPENLGIGPAVRHREYPVAVGKQQHVDRDQGRGGSVHRCDSSSVSITVNCAEIRFRSISSLALGRTSL